jgi:hypothetical protein
MSVPDGYAPVLAKLPTLEVSFDVGGLKLFPVSSLEDAQVGYSRTHDGKSLVGQDSGAWKGNWMVIGRETCCGDPIFIDVEDTRLPVFTAMHGEGSWNPQQIAISIEAFAASFQEFALVAKLRTSPVALKEHPVEDAERAAFLSRIEHLNQGLTGQEFWELMVSS